MMRLASIVFLFTSLTLTGCISATTSVVPGVSFGKLKKGVAVRVYASEIPSGTKGVLHVKDAPTSTKLGSVAVNGSESASWNAVVGKARKEAAKMGGDVLVVKHWGYVPVTGYAHSGGISLPVTASAKGLIVEARRSSQADIPGIPGLK